MKKINITTIVLLAYLIVMAVIGWPGHQPSNTFPEYFCVIGVTLGVIFVLRYMQIKRLKARSKWDKEEVPYDSEG